MATKNNVETVKQNIQRRGWGLARSAPGPGGPVSRVAPKLAPLGAEELGPEKLVRKVEPHFFRRPAATRGDSSTVFGPETPGDWAASQTIGWIFGLLGALSVALDVGIVAAAVTVVSVETMTKDYR